MKKLKITDFGKEKIILLKYDHSVRPTVLHIHDFIEIVYMEAGLGYHIVGNNRYELAKGDICIINTWLSHTFSKKDDNDLKIINCLIDPLIIQNKFLEINHGQDLESLFLSHYIANKIYDENADMRLKGRDTYQVADLMDKMYIEYFAKENGYENILESYLEILIYKIMRIYSKEKTSTHRKKTEVISNIMLYIKDHICENIEVSVLSKKFYISPKYLSKIFKNLTNMTIIEYIHKLKIEKAIQLLYTTDLGIRDIVFDIGYHDVTYFYKLFKRYTGKNPGDLRKFEKV